jgi:hypothetical protein
MAATAEIAHSNVPAAPAAAQLTDEEAQVYDRQIRLWGVEAQQR